MKQFYNFIHSGGRRRSVMLALLPLALLLLLGTTGKVNAQSTIFSDGFESGLSNWTATTGYSGLDWTQRAGTSSGGYSSAHNGSYNAGVQYGGTTNQYAYLQLNRDLSSYSNMSVSF